ncbi:zinc finger protein ubi-d4 B isoform X1 [Sitophilus oryzae]|uniref:Zinc finger protein ubi-d4 B isoform X1 n=1 Tax=Sitophilus oryzae TaxID=7048 RepID=A0A6J2YSP2_SITOR|nr:zinc finger protein ubi-d4 B isoform X1 [Sitophilus oryzae]
MATTTLPVVPPNNSQTNLEKIESFFNDSAYKEILESSVNFNTRLCIERRLRLPFIDTQTGVAQNHCSLFMHKRQRLPGILPGQIYSYPRQRWRKKRRQYLTMNARAYARHAEYLDGESDIHSISQIENPALQDTDSKDSQLLSGEVSKEWFYDEQDMLEMDTYDEPDPDSDLDYEETYSKRRKGRKGAGRGRSGTDSPSTPGRKRGSGRGRGKKGALAGHNFEPTPGDPDKPFACELCGARYKTRPGLTYHYAHSHKDGASDENSRDSATASPIVPPNPNSNSGSSGAAGVAQSAFAAAPPNPAVPSEGPASTAPAQGAVAGQAPPTTGSAAAAAAAAAALGQVYQDSYVSFLNQTPGTPGRRGRQPNQPATGMSPGPPPSNNAPPALPSQPMNVQSPAPPTLPPNLPPQQPGTSSSAVEDPPMPVLKPEKALETTPLPPMAPEPMGGPSGMMGMMGGDKKVPPSPYCDFCLGDSTQNKKTGGMEELVSCSDCGRSGHPTCLQFTDNMKISVKKYRWQCIECKCCSMCGNSDNDDQLLFCDDCDRGYHMYCLSPPLENPPEGSWSCNLCIEQFHNK